MSAASSTRRTRVVLGATCYADAAASLQVALILAKQISADIHGCLVMDDAILASVSYPNARAVAYSGRSFHSVSEQSMRAALRADARRFEDRLTAEARQASLKAAFTEAQGGLSGLLEQIAGAEDLVVFGFRRAIGESESIVLLLGTAEPDPDLLALGAALAQRLQKRLTIIAVPEHHADIADRLAQLSVTGFELAPYSDSDRMLLRLDRMSPAALLVGTDLSGTAALSRLMDVARCPVVVPMRKLSGASATALTRDQGGKAPTR